MSAPSPLLPNHLPDLWNESPREGLVFVQDVVEMVGQVADGNHAFLHSLGHQCAQTESPSMILHPTGLEGGVLTVVAKDEQPRTLRVMDHVLGQDVDVGHVGCSNLTSGLPIPSPDSTPVGPAREAAGELTRVVLLLAHREEFNRFAECTALPAARDGFGVCRAAVSAEVKRCCATTVLDGLVVTAADNAVGQHHPASALCFLERIPVGPIAIGFASPRLRSGELEVLEESDEVVLSAGRAGGDAKVRGLALAAGCLNFVLRGEPERGIT